MVRVEDAAHRGKCWSPQLTPGKAAEKQFEYKATVPLESAGSSNPKDAFILEQLKFDPPSKAAQFTGRTS